MGQVHCIISYPVYVIQTNDHFSTLEHVDTQNIELFKELIP